MKDSEKTAAKTAKKAASEPKRITAKARRRKRRKIHTAIFYSVYAVIIIAALIAVNVGKGKLRASMEGYEASQPKYAAEAAAQVFTQRDYAALFDWEDQSVFAAQHETREQYVQYMTDLLAGKEITWSEGYSTEADTKLYVVKADGSKIGDFTLRQSAEPDESGYRQWRLDDVKLYVLAASTYTVKAPARSTVTVDGVTLDDGCVTEDNIPLFTVSLKLPDTAKVPTAKVYTFSRYFGVQDVRVTDWRGNANAVTQSGRDYTAAFNYDDEDLSVNEERIIETVRKMSCSMTNDYKDYRFKRECVVTDSPAAKYIDAYDSDWVAKHTGYDFLNMRIDHYISYSDDCFSVEAHYDYQIKYRKADPEIYPTAYNLLLMRVDDEWRLYDFTLIS